MTTKYVIYSDSEASNYCGFWSNQDGWVDETGLVTVFSAYEKNAYANRLPDSSNGDARWLEVILKGARITLHWPGESVEEHFVSFGSYDEDAETGIDSFGQLDPLISYYTSFETLMEMLEKGRPLFDYAFIKSVDRYFLTPVVPERVINVPSNSAVAVEYWDSVKYTGDQGDPVIGDFQMEILDARATRGNVDVGICPSGGAIDDNLNAMFEINRLPGTTDDLPCIHIHIGDTHRLTIYQRNQELILRLGDDSERFENGSIATGIEIKGVPRYEQVIILK